MRQQPLPFHGAREAVPPRTIDSLADLVIGHLSDLHRTERADALVRLMGQVSTAVARLAATESKAGSQLQTQRHQGRLSRDPASFGLSLLKANPSFASVEPSTDRSIKPGSWVLRRVEQMLVAPPGSRIRLSGREFILMESLAQSRGHQLSRISINRAFGYDELKPDTRSLDSLIYRLRVKAGDVSLTLPLKAIHAVGIRFTQPLAIA